MPANEKFFITGDHLTDPEYASLTMLNFDQIAYEKLSDAVLLRLALDTELYIATCSLEELDRRNSPCLVQAATEVLRSKFADAYLKALAFDVLFERDELVAIESVKPLIQDGDPALVSKVARVLMDRGPLADQPTSRELSLSVLSSLQRLKNTQSGVIDDLLVSEFAHFVAGDK